MLDAAEDPEKMLDQMIRDYKNNIAEAEEAVAQTIESPDDGGGREGGVGQPPSGAPRRRPPWARRRSSRAPATPPKAAFENLARVALKKQIDYEDDAKTLQPTITQQNDVVSRLKSGLEGMGASSTSSRASVTS